LSNAAGFFFLSDVYSRRVVRIITVFTYFILFQSLILIQKPFLQFDFVVVFYLCFGVLFSHHLVNLFVESEEQIQKTNFASYLADFVVLMLFMKFFPYLSSFVLVLQLFLLFVASFDLDLFRLIILGFISSIGVSLINLSSSSSGSTQSILSITLFNLSYVSVIAVSRQLRVEFTGLQQDLSSTQKKWKSQEEFSKAVVENIPLGIAVFQKDMQPVLQNNYLAKNINLSTNQLLDFISEYKRSSGSNLSNVDFSYKSDDNRKKVIHLDETSYFDSELNEPMSVYLVKDVTEIRELEFQKKQNEKLAAVGQLAAGIAHEIRNPLAGISGSVQLLSQDSQDDTQKKLMSIILKEIDRLNNLITDFLDYAKPEKKPDAPVNLKENLEEVILLVKRHPELPANFEWQVDLKDATIIGFHEKLKQAFLNIVINGIQAMKDSKTPSCKIKVETEGSFAVVRITDTGSGMSEETKRKMFEPFHTTKVKGTGLGLAVTHKILETHSAQISVNSEINVGTEFVIRFPLTAKKSEEQR
jgi:two-component system sensor histidine kinase PilS (NtrC family)